MFHEDTFVGKESNVENVLGRESFMNLDQNDIILNNDNINVDIQNNMKYNNINISNNDRHCPDSSDNINPANESIQSVSDVDNSPPTWSPLSDQYCTVEEASSDACGDDDDVPLDVGSSLPAASADRGGVPTASGSNTDMYPSRPVRSTRGTLPNRYI